MKLRAVEIDYNDIKARFQRIKNVNADLKQKLKEANSKI